MFTHQTKNYYREQMLRKEKILLKKRRRRRKRAVRLLTLVILMVCIFFSAKITFDLIFKSNTEPEGKNHGGKITTVSEEKDKEVIAKEIDFVNSGYDSELYNELKKMTKEIPEVKAVINNFSEYPKKVLELLMNNPETLDFVLDYPEKIKDADITSNIDIKKDCENPGIPLFIQWDKRWGYKRYGDSIMALSGCGPTCLSMVASGLLKDNSLNPNSIAELSMEKGYISEDNSTSWDLMTEGAILLGLKADELPLDENIIINELLAGNPIICSMRPGDFTTTGHFIVLRGYEDGKILINDPNSRERSNRGWLYSDIEYQIKNLWNYKV